MFYPSLCHLRPFNLDLCCCFKALSLVGILSKQGLQDCIVLGQSNTVVVTFKIFLPAFLDTDMPRGNGHERDSKIPCKVPCLPNPATREGWPHHQGQPPLLFSNSNVGSFMSHKNRSVKVLWDGTYGFSSLSEKTRTSDHLKLSLQRQHFLLGYLKTLRVCSARVWTHDLPLSRLALSQLS